MRRSFFSPPRPVSAQTNFFRSSINVGKRACRRVSTPALNNWLKDEVDLQRGTTPKARPVRIYYMTQAKIAPPTFLIFTNQKEPLHFSYQRFLENQLRAKFDYVGTPVRFIQRMRKREKRNTGGDSDRDE